MQPSGVFPITISSGSLAIMLLRGVRFAIKTRYASPAHETVGQSLTVFHVSNSSRVCGRNISSITSTWPMMLDVQPNTLLSWVPKLLPFYISGLMQTMMLVRCGTHQTKEGPSLLQRQALVVWPPMWQPRNMPHVRYTGIVQECIREKINK